MTVDALKESLVQNVVQAAEKVVSIGVMAPNLDDASALALKTRISELIKDVPGGQIHFAIHERNPISSK